MTDLLMVCKFMFIWYGRRRKKILAFYVPRFNFGDPPKSKNAPFWNKKSIEFELTIQIFFGCKSKSFEARRLLIQTLYGMLWWNLSKSAHNSDIQGTGVSPPPFWLVILRGRTEKGWRCLLLILFLAAW